MDVVKEVESNGNSSGRPNQTVTVTESGIVE
jgi:hypothetical protein